MTHLGANLGDLGLKKSNSKVFVGTLMVLSSLLKISQFCHKGQWQFFCICGQTDKQTNKRTESKTDNNGSRSRAEWRSAVHMMLKVVVNRPYTAVWRMGLVNRPHRTWRRDYTTLTTVLICSDGSRIMNIGQATSKESENCRWLKTRSISQQQQQQQQGRLQ